MSSDPCSPPRCGPTSAAAPVCEPTYQCSFAVGIQAQVDAGRKVLHTMGFRPYTVALVWQEFNRAKHEWVEVERLLLMPVKVVALNSQSRNLGEGGVFFEGPVQLEEVSPQQVNEAQLRGYRQVNGAWVNWAEAAKSSEREFFYEIQAMRRCAGDPEPMRYRFTLGTAVHHDGEGFQFLFSLVPEIVQRGAGGKDRSLEQPRPPLSTVIRL